MCGGGRIRHHLRYNRARADSTILFVGFQAAGTLGRTILDGAKRVRISGRTISVQARIRTIGSYTGHADQAELVGWIEDRRPIAGSLFLTHGEERRSEEHTSELQSLMRISYAVFCLKKKKTNTQQPPDRQNKMHEQYTMINIIVKIHH